MLFMRVEADAAPWDAYIAADAGEKVAMRWGENSMIRSAEDLRKKSSGRATHWLALFNSVSFIGEGASASNFGSWWLLLEYRDQRGSSEETGRKGFGLMRGCWFRLGGRQRVERHGGVVLLGELVFFRPWRWGCSFEFTLLNEELLLLLHSERELGGVLGWTGRSELEAEDDGRDGRRRGLMKGKWAGGREDGFGLDGNPESLIGRARWRAMSLAFALVAGLSWGLLWSSIKKKVMVKTRRKIRGSGKERGRFSIGRIRTTGERCCAKTKGDEARVGLYWL
jgi:hypothetical protein